MPPLLFFGIKINVPYNVVFSKARNDFLKSLSTRLYGGFLGAITQPHADDSQLHLRQGLLDVRGQCPEGVKGPSACPH